MFFLFLHENLCCEYSLEAPRRGASNEYPQHVSVPTHIQKIRFLLTKHNNPGPAELILYALPEMSNPVFWKKNKKNITNLLTAELAQRVVNG